MNEFLFGQSLHKKPVGLMNQLDTTFGPEQMRRGEAMFAPREALERANLQRQFLAAQEDIGASGLNEAARLQMSERARGQFGQGVSDIGMQYGTLGAQAGMDIFKSEGNMLISGMGTEEQIRASRFANQGGGFMDWMAGAASGFLGGLGGNEALKGFTR